MGCDYVKYKSVDFIPGKTRSRKKKKERKSTAELRLSGRAQSTSTFLC